MRYLIPESLIRKLLLAVSLFVFLSSLAGGLGLVGWGAGLPLDLIEGSVFSSYLIPGLILGFIVGGTNLAAFIALLKRKSFSADFSAVAGFGLVIWIFVEMYIIESSHWLHALYFGCGIAVLILAFLLRSTEKR